MSGMSFRVKKSWDNSSYPIIPAYNCVYIFPILRKNWGFSKLFEIPSFCAIVRTEVLFLTLLSDGAVFGFAVADGVFVPIKLLLACVAEVFMSLPKCYLHLLP